MKKLRKSPCGKGNLETIFSELQTRLEFMTTERGLLNYQNRELIAEVEFFKMQLNESNHTPAQLEDKPSLLAAKMFPEKENNSLETEIDRRTSISEEHQKKNR